MSIFFAYIDTVGNLTSAVSLLHTSTHARTHKLSNPSGQQVQALCQIGLWSKCSELNKEWKQTSIPNEPQSVKLHGRRFTQFWRDEKKSCQTILAHERTSGVGSVRWRQRNCSARGWWDMNSDGLGWLKRRRRKKKTALMFWHHKLTFSPLRALKWDIHVVFPQRKTLQTVGSAVWNCCCILREGKMSRDVHLLADWSCREHQSPTLHAFQEYDVSFTATSNRWNVDG